MRGYELREMSFGEILDAALGLYRANLGLLVTISVILQGIPMAIQAYSEGAGGFIANPILWALGSLLSAVFGLLASAATLRVISNAYLARESTLEDALSFAAGRMVPLFLAGLAKYLIVFIGLLFLIAPGVILALGYSVVTQVVVLEKPGNPLSALGRSWHLTKGKRGRALGLAIVSFLIVYIPVIALGVAAAILPVGEVGAAAIGYALGLVLYPIFLCVFTLYYYDLRVRHEAFDLQFLSTQMGIPTES